MKDIWEKKWKYIGATIAIAVFLSFLIVEIYAPLNGFDDGEEHAAASAVIKLLDI